MNRMKIIVLLLVSVLLFESCKKKTPEIDPDTLQIIDLDYGEQSTFKDNRDGQQYHFTPIGNYDWMTENLRYNVESSKIYDNKNVNLQWYGRLYTQSQAQTACPEGWGLPSTEEWKNLCETLLDSTFLDSDFPPTAFKSIDSVGSFLAFNATRSDKTTVWISGRNSKSNKAKFYALPAGIYGADGATFSGKGSTTTWWSVSKQEDKYYHASINRDENKFYYKAFYNPESSMFSVRCVRPKVP